LRKASEGGPLDYSVKRAKAKKSRDQQRSPGGGDGEKRDE